VSDLIERVRRRIVVAPDDLDGAVRAESRAVVDDVVLAGLRAEVVAETSGAGVLEPLLAQPGVTDVLVSACDSVWVDAGGGLVPVGTRFVDDAAVRRLAQRLASQAGRRLDDAQPVVDAVLPDGTRLHAVLPPLVEHPTLSLRVFGGVRRSLDDLVRAGTMSDAVADVLRAVVDARLSFVISGGTGSGKTTLLGAMLGLVPADQRIVTIEDARELTIEHRHVVRMSARPPNIEGAGEVTLRDLVKAALRMRPDRLVVGEFRGAEMADLAVALNTGHDGGAATIHANSAADVPARFAALGLLAGVPAAAVTALVVSGLRVVVHLSRPPGGPRRVDAIGLLDKVGDELVVASVWSCGAAGPAASRLGSLVASRGVAVPGALQW
jgi:pilus assembly protein CpaF